MTNQGQRTTLLVVHVPKAAGTTLRWILDRQYPQSHVFKIGDDIPDERVRLRNMPKDEKRALRVVFGHQCFGWHSELEWGQGFQYLTILRDPVERVLSLYAYTFLPGHYLHDIVQGMSVYDWVTSGATRTADEGMVRQLCGDDAFLRGAYEDMVLPFGGVTREHLNKAKENVKRFAVAGVSEEFEDVLDQCRRVLGWRIPIFENQNITRWPRPKRAQLDRRTLDAIEAHVQFDRELYEFVKRGRDDFTEV